MPNLPTPFQYLFLAAAVIIPTSALAGFSLVLSNTTESEIGRLAFEVFWVGEESNVPTFINFLLLIVSSGFIALAAAQAFSDRDPWRWHWLGLAVVVLLAAFDDAAQVHEPVGTYLTKGIEGSGLFAWEWVYYGFAVVAILVLLGFRFVVYGMDAAPRRYLVLGALVYFGAALGLEMVSAFMWFHEMDNGRYVTLLEETFEMFGAALFGACGLRQLMPVPEVRKATHTSSQPRFGTARETTRF
ncbi:hypothetical protein [Ruegeria profundi]|uniref:hypothetical protein n=1 Tax=Ruegeria profundi TaxID=1685378 RepID=UPI001CD6AAF2|nr:hypothetical protein [Ruegeria profundi]MCA0930080.1 hypothetical protein [Ruegeria profundi]